MLPFRFLYTTENDDNVGRSTDIRGGPRSVNPIQTVSTLFCLHCSEVALKEIVDLSAFLHIWS